jgi:nucleotide-binding universal stress UspA family protein
LAARRDDRLFADILVAINGQETGWLALESALEVARHEEARLHGLHVVASETQRESPEAQAVRAEFNRRCEGVDIPTDLAIVSGKVVHRICERARWTDLVVLSLNYPPAPQPMARLGSGLSALLRRCPRPVLAVPRSSPCLSRALLAYDGSPKADEALFVATYVAGKWSIPLVVVTVIEPGRTTSEAVAKARSYLETHGVQAEFMTERDSVADAIMKVAQEHDKDLIVMGGYGHAPVLAVVLGSAVDEVLRASRRPMLICR